MAAVSPDTTVGSGARVLRFEAPTDVSCTGDTATIQVVYETVDLTAVSFIVDGKPLTGSAAPGSVAPATSGSYPVSVPCDGNVHTIQLVGAGPIGPGVRVQSSHRRGPRNVRSWTPVKRWLCSVWALVPR